MLVSSSKMFPGHLLAIVCTVITSTYGMTPRCQTEQVEETLSATDSTSTQSGPTKGLRFAWNKTLFTAEEYHQTYCRESCSRGRTFVGCMLSCSCQSQRPACEIYNSCCPNLSTPSPNIAWEYGDVFPRGHQKETSRRRRKETVTEKEHPKLECFQTDEFSFLHIRSCPPEYSVNRSVADLCERDMALDQLTLDTYIPYVDMETQVFYRNKFCALCNDKLGAIPIDTNLGCNSHMFVYKATNIDELLRFHLMDKVNCKVTFTLPETIERPFTCYQEQFGENVIDTCEQAPGVDDIDQDIVVACNQLTAAKYRVWHTSALKFYRNIFCAICDMKSYPILIERCACLGLPVDRTLRPSSLIRLTFQGEFLISRNPAIASADSIHLGGRYQNTSLQLHCAQGKILENKTCTTIFSDIRALQYNLKMWLLPFGLASDHQLDSPSITNVVNSVKAKLHSILGALTSHYVVTVSAVCVQGKSGINLKSCSFWTDSKILGNVTLPRSVFEDMITEELTKNYITVKVSENLSMDLQPMVAIGEFVFESCCNGNNSITGVKCFEGDDIEVTEDLTGAVRFLNDAIDLSATLTCSFVSFNRSCYDIYTRGNGFHSGVQTVVPKIPPKIIVRLRFRDREKKLEVSFSETSELNLLRKDERGSLNVCSELIERKFKIQI